ncbi:hypothetical protein [Agromyces larvae]|uniref:Uncharacterized protein n=1 Tax=Agromyces larvae TaxID=2929802 RepID=A0ABY4C2H9_9MICO|nr:hypothetical protein [Agromyces larvae]UOE45573.1 hypothetical protein MTO99_07415 [Agromyces larvae]
MGAQDPRREGARADQRWETDGGSLAAGAEPEASVDVVASDRAEPAASVDAVASEPEPSAEADRTSKRERKARWRTATGEHWHRSGYSDDTKRRRDGG